MIENSLDPRQFSSRTLLVVGFVAVVLLATSFLVEVRIIVTDPNYGDVTQVLRASWQVLLGVATLGSFLLAVLNARADDVSTESPARAFEIKGENHDIDFHLHGPEPPERDERSDHEEGERVGEPSAARNEHQADEVTDRTEREQREPDADEETTDEND